MRILTRYIFKEHLIPFFLSLMVIALLFLINFLAIYANRILGKGIPFPIILELLALNMGWVLALATPMAVLPATLMAFGRFSEDNEITALKASGVSFSRILWPALAFSIAVTAALLYFNNAILPNTNHKLKMLKMDIARKRPDLDIEPGYFIDHLPQYSLRVKDKKGERFQEVEIYNKDWSKTRTSIFAKEGIFSTVQNAIVITLYDGEINEIDANDYLNYRRIIFEKHRITIPADDLTLKRRESASRSDREMTIAMMKEKIAGYQKKMGTVEKRISKHLERTLSITEVPRNLKEVTALIEHYNEEMQKDTTLTEKQKRGKQRSIKALSQRIKSDFKVLEGYQKNINRYSVEIHKKFSVPVACIVFVLVGAPLGVMVRKGGIFLAIVVSLVFFIIYWIFLVGGEQLSDRNLLNPAIAMWTPNILLGIAGIYLSIKTSREEKIMRIPFITGPSKKD